MAYKGSHLSSIAVWMHFAIYAIIMLITEEMTVRLCQTAVGNSCVFLSQAITACHFTPSSSSFMYWTVELSCMFITVVMILFTKASIKHATVSFYIKAITIGDLTFFST